jgi:tetratricopeptide (TPR) repeat protein
MTSGNTRLALHTETHDESDLLAACEIAQSLPSHAFSLSTAHAPALESFLESLHSALCEHAKTTPDPALQYATSISRLSLVLRPAELDTRLEFLNARALTLHDWFHKCSDEKSTTGLEVLMEAVVLRRRLVAMTTSDDQKREQRSSLASLLWCYWKCNGESDLDVLQEEIDLRREILQAQGVYDPERVTACESLATSVYTLYKSSGDLMILNEALDLQREALRLRPKGHPYRAASCANLATLLWTRFDQTRDTLLLDEALELQREALRLMPVGHPDRAIMCGALANSLHTHLNQTGDMLLLDEALELQREALRLRPERHPDRAALCAIRAALLRTRFDQTGATLLLDEALELGREALRLTPEGHPNRAALCANLATSLWTRFNQTWDTLLLGEALELQREALRLTPEGHPDRAALCANLAASLWTRFHQTGDTLLLDEALELEREALRLRPEGHPDRALSCGNLANAMRTCFNQTGDTLLLDEALELYREALRLWPEGHPDRALLCGNLANALRTCFDQTGDTLLLDEARFLCTLTTKESVVSSSNHVYLRVQLSRIYTLPAYSSYSPTVAVSLLIEVLHHRVGLIRHFYDINDALRKCAKAALSHEDNERLLTIYRVMIEVLPELGTAVLDQTSRLERWRDAGSLPLEAFLHALKANDIPLGLQLLEQGRAVLWSQTLAMRDPQIEKLPDAWKHQLKTLLRSMSSSTDRIDVPRTDLTARDWAHTSYTRLQQLLKEIRASPGLERFMRGPSYPELVHAATVHPVVLLAIMEDTACHAVVISSASALPVHLILDSITASELGKLGDDMRGLDLNVRAVCGLTAATGERGMNSTGGREDPAVRKLHQALKRLWIGIVKPIFDCLGLEVREICFACLLC